MIKVLNVVTQSLTTDGITNYLLNYYNNLDNNKIQFDFVCPSILPMIEKQINEKSGKIYILKDRKNVIRYIYKLKNIIKNNMYDIVHIHGSSSILVIELLASYFAGCKIRIIHSHNTKTQHPHLHKLLKPLFNLLCTDRFACGRDAGIWLFGKKNFIIIPNGNDISKFEYNESVRNEIRKKYNLQNKIVVGHVGVFNEQKNHLFLLEVIKKLKESNPNKYKFVLIGDGILYNTIIEKSKEYGIYDNIIFTGRTNEVPKWLQAMDIMLLPSLYEGFPMVLIEWQIAGLPCVISDRITKDVKITDLVYFRTIDSSKIWCDTISNIKINNREKNKVKIIRQIKKEGYDIAENAEKLEREYINLYDKYYK